MHTSMHIQASVCASMRPRCRHKTARTAPLCMPRRACSCPLGRVTHPLRAICASCAQTAHCICAWRLRSGVLGCRCARCGHPPIPPSLSFCISGRHYCTRCKPSLRHKPKFPTVADWEIPGRSVLKESEVWRLHLVDSNFPTVLVTGNSLPRSIVTKSRLGRRRSSPFVESDFPTVVILSNVQTID